MLTFRDATESDWPGIWPFWHRSAVEGETYTWNPESTSDQDRAGWLVRGPRGRTIVALDGAEIRASAQLQPNYGPASKIANASFIVDPDFAGRGIGRQLVAHVLDQARNAAAVHLYETFGFSTKPWASKPWPLFAVKQAPQPPGRWPPSPAAPPAGSSRSPSSGTGPRTRSSEVA